MRGRRWIVIGMIVCMLFMVPFAAASETEAEQTENSGWTLNDIEININGMPLGDVLETAGGMFADAVGEHVGEAITGLNEVFGEFAEDFSADLKELGGTVDGMIEDTWRLQIPAVSLNETIKRSEWNSAMELYLAQTGGETGKGARIAAGTEENSGNNIIYIYEDGDMMEEILAAAENGSLAEQNSVFGMEGFYGEYAVCAVTYLPASEEEGAMCDMVDLSDEEQFDAYRDYVMEHAAQTFGEAMAYGDRLVTIIFWNEESDGQWLTIVGKEVPVALE